MVCMSHDNRCRLSWLFSCALLLVTGCQDKFSEPTDHTYDAQDIQVIRPASVDGLQAYFQALNYEWDTLEEGVPPLIIEKLPEDFDAELSTEERKKTFFMSLLPMVLLANQSIEEERRELLALLEQFKGTRTLEPEEREWVMRLTRNYGLRGDPLTDHRTRNILLRRIDIIPPSLALAQAANESGWGTSRFVREGNNLFGQWTFTPGTGIVPANRPPGATYEVQRFNNLNASIRSYFKNLNTHSAYQGLRLTRERLREAGQPVTGRTLAGGLQRYSTRGDEYVREIRAMIDHNNLADLNRATLSYAGAHTTQTVGPGGAGLLTSRYHMSGKSLTAAQTPTTD